MPLFYGEGWKAFQRLQEEIIRTNTDQTIFAWKVHSPESRKDWAHLYYGGILASSPADFRDSGRIVRATKHVNWYQPAHSISNSGLQIDLPIAKLNRDGRSSAFLAILDCHLSDDSNGRLGILLRLNNSELPLPILDSEPAEAEVRSPVLFQDEPARLSGPGRLYCHRTAADILEDVHFTPARKAVSLTVSPLWKPPISDSTFIKGYAETEAVLELEIGTSGYSLLKAIADEVFLTRDKLRRRRRMSYIFSNGLEARVCVAMEWLDFHGSAPTETKINIEALKSKELADLSGEVVRHPIGWRRELSTDTERKVGDHKQWTVRAKMRHGMKVSSGLWAPTLELTVAIEETPAPETVSGRATLENGVQVQHEQNPPAEHHGRKSPTTPEHRGLLDIHFISRVLMRGTRPKKTRVLG
ncbi:hypothetical protein H2200_005231 [Cladophialophora chaetospira]|uniref:DUF8212 domain-containing protein n=1 Tax=Cladophialophora chaetospira TaxID=386627 RepID=A0AA39CIR4_9EURO|nr:hypothetical protein H2200_005231 [Cladophialophora chaetospira]